MADFVSLCAFCDEPIVQRGRRPSRPRVICDRKECRRRASAFGARKLIALNARRRAAAPPKTEHTCKPCGRTLPFTPEHFYVDRRDPETGAVHLSRWCKECKRGYQRVKAGTEAAARRNARRAQNRRERIATDPEYAERRRRQAREAARRRRARDPEAHRAAQRRYRERLKRDPKRLAAKREADRIARRLRKERAGLPMNQRTRTEGRDADTGMPRLPALPLAQFIDKLVAVERGPEPKPNNDAEKVVCARLGVDPRQVRAWRVGEFGFAQFDVADRILTAADRSPRDVWPEDDYPAVHEALFA